MQTKKTTTLTLNHADIWRLERALTIAMEDGSIYNNFEADTPEEKAETDLLNKLSRRLRRAMRRVPE